MEIYVNPYYFFLFPNLLFSGGYGIFKLEIHETEDVKMPVYQRMEELIGKTPLLALERIAAAERLQCRLLAKLECFNPAGSAKDRIALSMLDCAERSGRLQPGAVIIEPTSGNTGVALAALASARGYRCILTMPESMSLERRRLLAAYGAEIVLTPASEGMQGAVARAEELAAKTPGAFIPGQFDNPDNPAAHYQSTGPEIWNDTEGAVDAFVAGVGTGGTLSGSGRYLKEQKPSLCLVAVEPAGSPLLSEGRAGKHGLQGIGANFVPANLDRGLIDRIVTVTDEDAYAASRMLAAREGLLCGISSGAALWAALQLAKEEAFAGKCIVALLPDTGERYLSTGLCSGD